VGRWGLLLICVLAAEARAEDPASLAPLEQASARAEDLARRALARHRAGDARGAAELFLEAFALSGNPTQLRNAAKALEQAGLLERALATWQRLRALDGVDAHRQELADAHIAALRAQLRTQVLEQARGAPPAPTPASVPTPALVAPSPAPVTSPLRWVLVGSGVAALGGAAALYASGYATYAEFVDTGASGQTVSRADADAAQLRAGAGVALGVGALATIAAAVVVPMVMAEEAEPESP
jgi:tetratricopeptide (TPR) repeat protein